MALFRHSYYGKGYSVALFPETDISITNVQRLSPHVAANWHKTIWCKGKGAYRLLVIRRWSWHMWWKSLYKYMRLETLGVRWHVENSWDTHRALRNVFPAHPSYMYVVRLKNGFYSWVSPLTHTHKHTHTHTKSPHHHPRGLCIGLIVAKHSGH